MSIKETPRQSAKRVPAQNMENGQPTEVTTLSTTAARLIAAVRIGLGLIFAWAFVDKVFGLGYATPSANAWIDGGSPTKGFLGGIKHGPFQSLFNSWAGDAWADWLFMIGLAGIAVALLAGIGLRIAAVSGSLLLLLMWAAEWPFDRHDSTGALTRSTNPVLDDHLIYAVLLILFAVVSAGAVWGLGKRWAQLDFVQKNRWLI
jgi:thiosulfate dehydrogenase [quinone] large subunit